MTTTPASTAPDFFEQIKATLTADGAAAVTWFENAYNNFGTVLTKIASGAEMLIEDIVSVAEGVNAHVGLANAALSAASGLVTALPVSDQAAAQKALSSVSAATNDVALLGAALKSGNAAGDPQIVQTANSAITAAQTLVQTAMQASSMI